MSDPSPSRSQGDLEPANDGDLTRLPREFLEPITDVSRYNEPEEAKGAVGRTMFDTPGAQDGSVTVLLPKETIQAVPIQAMVRITSDDGRRYLGIVTSGPFAEPDGLRADANVIVTTSVRGGILMPRYHGRVQVELLGEELDGRVVPPRFRPLPNSPVHVLTPKEKLAALHPDGDLQLGVLMGDPDVTIGIPSDRKSVLPRHLGVLGTTGGGKSTTISRLIAEAQAAGIAVVLLDTEGEYVHIGEPTEDDAMLAALERRGMKPVGVPNTHLFHLVGTDTAHPNHPHRTEFGLSFPALSPYTVAEIVNMTDAQQERFFRTVDVAKQVLRDLKIYPTNAEQERQVLELNEFEEGYPTLTLSKVIDLASVFLAVADHASTDDLDLYNREFQGAQAMAAILKRVNATKPQHAVSWRATLARLWRLHRMRIFDQPRYPALRYGALLRPGQVSIIDLSGTDSPTINNIVIADMLRNIQRAQDDAYQEWERRGAVGQPRKVIVIIEEAHEFLSADRIAKMPILFEQVSRIAKRGRKRWLALAFVTQLPQHLPREVLGLVNNHVLHKISDEAVIRTLRHVIPGVDDGQWRRLPALAPGQAVVSFTHMARPLLAAIDPTPCRLRMID
ncbi:MAG: ATP-binding protein [Mycobacterium sp.]|uniref:ATP-binding protein n=1 Tax=Mycobacterium sp. TaxID=1785 RepID=UPI0026124909|nr:ATP-binding protein [Mycobacterium sp.]MDI3315943.1 ATP-binding protein [Mycobacterium sp.]